MPTTFTPNSPYEPYSLRDAFNVPIPPGGYYYVDIDTSYSPNTGQPDTPPYIYTSRHADYTRLHLSRCSGCGDRVTAQNRSTFTYVPGTRDRNQYVVCRNCNHGECAACHSPIYAETQSLMLNNRRVCRSCAIQCYNCRTTVARDEAHQINLGSDGDFEQYGVCNTCLTLHKTCNVGHSYLGKDECPVCREYYVHSHSFRPQKPVLLGNGPLWLGAEVEVELGDYEVSRFRHAFRTSGLCEYLYFKHDGSLSNGVEIVTLPCSLDFHRTTFPWDALCNLLAQQGASADTRSTCGLHVHMSKTAFPMNVWERMSYLVNNNQALMERIARRTQSERYAAYKPKHNIKGLSNDGDRYQAVNFTNQHTVELRIFRGSVRQPTILATLEFCVALAEYCQRAYLWEIKSPNKAQVGLLKYAKSDRFTYLPDYLSLLGL